MRIVSFAYACCGRCVGGCWSFSVGALTSASSGPKPRRSKRREVGQRQFPFGSKARGKYRTDLWSITGSSLPRSGPCHPSRAAPEARHALGESRPPARDAPTREPLVGTFRTRPGAPVHDRHGAVVAYCGSLLLQQRLGRGGRAFDLMAASSLVPGL